MPGTIHKPVSLNSRAGCKNHSLIALLNWIILTLTADWSIDQANSDISFLKHLLFCLIQVDEMPQEVNFTYNTRYQAEAEPESERFRELNGRLEKENSTQ